VPENRDQGIGLNGSVYKQIAVVFILPPRVLPEGATQLRHEQTFPSVSYEKDSEAVLGVWLPAPLPTPRALPNRGALWPLAVGAEKDLGGIDV